ncbi:MAG TPA: hypothetical protein VF662_01930 [Allosphingosinicella sp.]|jgi:hypothetical protein
MRYLVIASVLAGIAAPGGAQVVGKSATTAVEQRPITSGWSAEWTLKANPAFGKSLPFESGTDIIDDSEFEAGASIARAVGAGGKLSFSFGATASPNLLDDDDLASGAFFQVGLSGADRLTGYRGSSNDNEDTVRPFLQYRATRSYRELFESRKFDEHRLRAGVTFRNVLRVVCRDNEDPSIPYACTGGSGVYWDIEPAVDLVLSKTGDRERLTPKVRTELNVRVSPGISLSLEANGEARFYTSQRTQDGEKREDWKANGFIGADFSGALQRLICLPPEFTVKAGARLEGNWSNQDKESYERAYAVPSFSVKTAFGPRKPHACSRGG